MSHARKRSDRAGGGGGDPPTVVIPGVPKKTERWIFSTLHSKSGIFFDIIR